MSIFSDTLENLIEKGGISCPAGAVEKCEAYFGLLLDANKTTNLTRITDEEQAAQMHFYGAIELTKYFELKDRARVIDIGSGAGFPGIPLKIIRPGIDLTLMDSAGKKTDFIKEAAVKTGIDVCVIKGRAEEAGKLRETFDTAVSRAVANLSMLLELCIPLLKTGGSLAAFKGQSYGDELEAAGSALEKLFCSVSAVHKTGEGAIVIIQKQEPTPDIYPRRFSKIKSDPL